MKTPLRGEMLRGADFIIAVVNAGRSDPIPTILRGRGQASGARAIPACTLLHGCKIHNIVKFYVNKTEVRSPQVRFLPAIWAALQCAENKSDSVDKLTRSKEVEKRQQLLQRKIWG